MKIKSFKPKLGQVVSSQPSTVNSQKPVVFKAPEESVQVRPSGGVARSNGPMVTMVPLGGVGDVTKNMFVYEYKDDIVIVDCGVSFPDDEMLGVDLVIPDISYLRDKKHKVRGIVITHGHDDHYGALPYIWPELDVPIYSQKLTCGLIKNKFTDHNLPKDKIKPLGIDDTIQLGSFKISFYRVSHSVPDTTGIVLQTPIGTIIHQSDFKLDWTPVNGQIPDLGKVARLGQEGVMFMTIDALRVEKQGYTISEKTIEPIFSSIELKTKGKLLITLITSNITRIQQAVNVAAKSGRKVAFSGRSMENNFQVARDLGYLDIPPGLIIAQEEIKRYPDNKLMVIIAGSFGQPGSALSRAANNDHKYIRINPNDTVVFSADPMPSAESAQSDLIDEISRMGCKVYYSALDSDLHVSGHAAQEEIKLMVNLAKPKYVMPIGGNFKHLRAFKDVMMDMGLREDQIILPPEVRMIEITSDKVRLGDRVETANVYVDGLGVGDVGSIILRDRKLMSEEGVVVVVVRIEPQSGKFSGEPDIISRGFVFGEMEQDLMDAGRELVKSTIKVNTDYADIRYIRKEIEDILEKFFYEETKRTPLILTLVIET